MSLDTMFVVPFYHYHEDEVAEGRYPLPPADMRDDLTRLLDDILERNQTVPVPYAPGLYVSGARIATGFEMTVSKRVAALFGRPARSVEIASVLVAPDAEAAELVAQRAMDLFDMLRLPIFDWPGMEDGPEAPFTAVVAGADVVDAVDEGFVTLDDMKNQTGFSQLVVAMFLERAGLKPVTSPLATGGSRQGRSRRAS